MKSGLYKLDEAQHATVLAALRLYQRNVPVNAISTNDDNVEPLDAAAIDELCESINHDGVDVTQALNAFEDAEDDPYYTAALRDINEDGKVEVHFPPVVSESDNGAYVLAWVWVSNEAAGVTSQSDDDDEDDNNTCRKCGEPNDNGEGWDGLCGNCADRAEAEKTGIEA